MLNNIDNFDTATDRERTARVRGNVFYSKIEQIALSPFLLLAIGTVLFTTQPVLAQAEPTAQVSFGSPAFRVSEASSSIANDIGKDLKKNKLTASAQEKAEKADETPDLGAEAQTAAQEQKKEVNNGTDPTRLTTILNFSTEYLSLRGGRYNNTVKFFFEKPITNDARTALRFTAPLVNTNVLGDNGIGVGDVSLKLTKVAKVTRSYGIVAAGEIIFPSASRTELGSGKFVAKPSLIYAKFLKGGSIFAPAIVHSVSFAGKSNRASVNNTVFDFYFVPKLKDPKNFITIDPALTLDWETRRQYGLVAVTFGRTVGKVFGGIAQVSAKPTVFIGGERVGNWGMQFGFKILGF
jgi:hypothetical protein